MLRTNPRTRIVLLTAACALTSSGVIAGPASAFENALYRGTVQVSSPTGKGWGPRASDGKQYVLDLRLSLPRELNTNVGTTSYKAIGGVVVCRGTVRLIDQDLRESSNGPWLTSVTLGESRRSPSTRGASRGKRTAITRARKWCRGGAWRFALAYDAPLDPPAPRVGLRDEPWGWSATYYLTRRP